jgi:hypothetical protein
VGDLIERTFAVVFPLFFAAMWLIVTTFLGMWSGWFRLAARFPDREEEAPILRLHGQSGAMGRGVSMRGILRLSACPGGLRVGMTRLFGPFCRDFFVPWDAIGVTRKKRWFSPVAELRFGSPGVGSLTIPARVANRLARAAEARWPEAGPLAEEPHGVMLRRLLAEWAVSTCVVALFFILVPLVVAPEARPPVAVAILFPALLYGLVALARYVREWR